MARLFEKRGNFAHAIGLWQLVKEVAPSDVEAAHKAKDLAASATIARGGYDGSGEKPVQPSLTLKPGVASGGKDTPVPAAEPADRVNREAAPILARLDTNPTDPHLYLQLANVYLRANQPDRARAALEQGLGPTANDFRLTLELMEMDLDAYRKNLEIAEADWPAPKAATTMAATPPTTCGEFGTNCSARSTRAKSNFAAYAPIGFRKT